MHHHIVQRLALSLILFTIALPAPAASCKTRHTCGTKVKRTQDSSSGESAQQRDQRLKRECKGRPNAGACLGYAS